MKKHKDSLWYRGLKQAERSWTDYNGNLNVIEEALLDYKAINGEDDFYKGIKDYLEYRLENQKKGLYF